MPTFSYFWRRLSLLLFGLIVGLLLLELFLRLSGFSYPILADYHPLLGTAGRPGVSGRYVLEGESHVQLNSEGWRDAAHVKAKPAGSYRIAILGDSYVHALQVPFENSLGPVLETALQTCPQYAGRKVEVLNFGMGGYGTAQELLVLRHYVWDYEPDLVLLAFCTGNDVVNNSRALEVDDIRPFFNVEADSLVLDLSFRTDPRFLKGRSLLWRLSKSFSDRLRLGQLFYRIRHARAVRAELDRVEAQMLADPPAPGIEPLQRIYLEPVDEVWQEAWTVTEALLLEMAGEVRERGARFVLVTLSNGDQVHPDPTIRRELEERLGVDDLLYPDRRLGGFARQNGLEIVQLARTFQSTAERGELCLHGFSNALPCGGHWNERGHRLAAELVAEYLCSHVNGWN